MAEPADSEEVARLKAENAALKAQLQGSGALAQGNWNVVAGEKGMAAGRDIINNPPSPGAGEEDLRTAYLNRLVLQTRPFALGGVDPAITSGERDASFVALCLAGERLGLPGLNLDLLTAPMSSVTAVNCLQLPREFFV